MTHYLIAAANDSSETLYNVNLDVFFAIPLVFFISLIVSVLIREFTHGWIKIVLAALFLLSFAAMWFVLEKENAPYHIVLPFVVFLGGLSGLIGSLRAALKDIQKF